MVEKEQKIRRIHRILIILVIVLAGALLLELGLEKGEWLTRELSVKSGEHRYFVMPRTRGKPGVFEPEITLTESESEYTVRCPLPGVRKGQIEVSVKGNYLTISARRDVEEERRSIGYERRILLPGMIDERGIRAEYKNGVLVISLPKRGLVEERESLEVQVI